MKGVNCFKTLKLFLCVQQNILFNKNKIMLMKDGLSSIKRCLIKRKKITISHITEENITEKHIKYLETKLYLANQNSPELPEIKVS